MTNFLPKTGKKKEPTWWKIIKCNHGPYTGLETAWQFKSIRGSWICFEIRSKSLVRKCWFRHINWEGLKIMVWIAFIDWLWKTELIKDKKMKSTCCYDYCVSVASVVLDATLGPALLFFFSTRRWWELFIMLPVCPWSFSCCRLNLGPVRPLPLCGKKKLLKGLETLLMSRG